MSGRNDKASWDSGDFGGLIGGAGATDGGFFILLGLAVAGFAIYGLFLAAR